MIRDIFSTTLGLAAVTLFLLRPAGAGEFEDPLYGYKSKGPAVTGSLTVIQSASGPPDVDIVFTGRCKGIDIDFSETKPLGPVAGVDKDFLKGYYLQGSGNEVPLACYVSSDLVIQAVSHFENETGTLTADVVMLFAIPNPPPPPE